MCYCVSLKSPPCLIVFSSVLACFPFAILYLVMPSFLFFLLSPSLTELSRSWATSGLVSMGNLFRLPSAVIYGQKQTSLHFPVSMEPKATPSPCEWQIILHLSPFVASLLSFQRLYPWKLFLFPPFLTFRGFRTYHVETPVRLRTPKFSSADFAQYLGGLPPGNTRCRILGCADGG